MAPFLLDNNLRDAVGQQLRAAPRHHTVMMARDAGLANASDSRLLHIAAHRGWIVLTFDRGFDALDEAWADWIVSGGHGPQHAGIVQMPQYGDNDAVVARQLDVALQAGWNPAGSLWFLDIRQGWRRMRAGRRWSVWDPASPLGLL